MDNLNYIDAQEKRQPEYKLPELPYRPIYDYRNKLPFIGTRDDPNKIILVRKETIEETVHKLAVVLVQKFGRDKEGRVITYKKHECPVMVPIIGGASYFFTDLAREISRTPPGFDIEEMYMSLQHKKKKVKQYMDVRGEIKDRHILLVDCIMSHGFTVKKAKEILRKRKPKSITTIVFMDKYSARKAHNVQPNYVGITIGNVSLYGYGLRDSQGLNRNFEAVAMEVPKGVETRLALREKLGSRLI